jgi:D-arabinose 1-dehydrogenase-like Zn-dependent alcohol dehydrogenase
MKGEIPFSSPCVVGHEITGEVVEHGQHTDAKTIERLKFFRKIKLKFLKKTVKLLHFQRKKFIVLHDKQKGITSRFLRVRFRLPVGSRVVGAFIMPCGNCNYCSKVTTLYYTLHSICHLNYGFVVDVVYKWYTGP